MYCFLLSKNAIGFGTTPASVVASHFSPHLLKEEHAVSIITQYHHHRRSMMALLAAWLLLYWQSKNRVPGRAQIRMNLRDVSAAPLFRCREIVDGLPYQQCVCVCFCVSWMGADFISRIYDLLCAGAGSFKVINRRFGNCYSASEKCGNCKRIHLFVDWYQSSSTLQWNWHLMHHPALCKSSGEICAHAHIWEEKLGFSLQS